MLKLIVIVNFVVIIASQQMIVAEPKFRILAPQFICPKDDGAAVDQPDNTVITIQTAAGSEFALHWSVRWTHLPRPSQRFTLMLWKAVRELEKKLNGPQPEPYVYVIENGDLLTGVDYIFSVTAISDGASSSPRSFHIDNTQGDQKLEMVDGRGDLMSVIMLGADRTFVDQEFAMEATVSTCAETHDYHFSWTVCSDKVDNCIDVTHINGSTLRIPPYTLKPGFSYYAHCDVIKSSTGLRITQNGLDFNVWHRGFKVYLSVDYIIVSVNHPFSIDILVVNDDYYQHSVTFMLKCWHDGSSCEEFEIVENNGTATIYTSGLSNEGQYVVSVTTMLLNQTVVTNCTVDTVTPILPVIEVTPKSRILNEGSILYLDANATNVAPSCSLTWYFAEENLSADFIGNGTCDDCQHGNPLSDTVTILSLEETFLNELTDFTNETEWRQVSAWAPAKKGRARFLARCGCSLTFECDTKGMVYADIYFEMNKSPKPGDVMISPETGVALETMFRISTLAVVDEDVPLHYAFYCKLGVNDTLLLGSHSEYLSVETVLPYIEAGTELWVEVCDSLGACSPSAPVAVRLSAPAAAPDAAARAARAHAARCEVDALRRVAAANIVTYRNTNQENLLSQFTTSLAESLKMMTAACIDNNYSSYSALISWLEQHGIIIA